MRIDLGVRPRWTIAGLILFVIGVWAEINVWTSIDHTPIWFAIFGPLVLGTGGGILLGQLHETWKLRRQARAWADAHPGVDPEDEVRERQRAQIPAEDNPHWTTYTRQWLGKPENPTDEADGSGHSD